MSDFELPEGFKLIPNRSGNSEFKKRRYGLSEKGEIFNVQTGETLVAPNNSDVITIRDEQPGNSYEAEFHIPTLLETYFKESFMHTRDPYFDKTLTDVTFTGKNFRGLEGPYNPEGRRHFAVTISEEQAKDLQEDGWTVKEVESKKGEKVKYIGVAFPNTFDIANIKLNGKQLTSDAELKKLDNYEIVVGSLTVFGRYWEIPGRTNKGGEVVIPSRKGVKAYIVSLDVTTKS